MEGLSSLDFRTLFLPCSGSFSGAPASKATPVDHDEIIKQQIITKDGSLQKIQQSGILAKFFMKVVLATGLACALL